MGNNNNSNKNDKQSKGSVTQSSRKSMHGTRINTNIEKRNLAGLDNKEPSKPKPKPKVNKIN